MDLLKMIAELQTEKQRLDEAIQALERLSAANSRRRGRPPRWAKAGQLEATLNREEEEEESEPSAKEG
jgi:hypothetical protein